MYGFVLFFSVIMKADGRIRKEENRGKQLNPGNLYGIIMPQLDLVFQEINRELEAIGFSTKNVFIPGLYEEPGSDREKKCKEEKEVWSRKHMTSARRRYEMASCLSLLHGEVSEYG